MRGHRCTAPQSPHDSHLPGQAYLDSYDYATAIWLCERLRAISAGTSGSAWTSASLLLAKCYYQSGKPNSACSVLKGCSDPESRYLYAMCCFELNRYPEAEQVLLNSTSGVGSVTDGEARDVPRGAHGYHLLGQICQRSSRRQHAIAYYKESLKLDSFAWASYEALCQLGPVRHTPAL